MWLKLISALSGAPTWLTLFVAPVAVLAGGIYMWQKYSGVRLRLSLQRTLRLRNEMKGKPLGLQLDAALVFGAEIDNRVIELADKRENPISLLRSYVRAQPLIRFKDDGFVEDGRPSKRTFKQRSLLALLFVTVYFFVAWLLLVIATSYKDLPPQFLLTVLSLMCLLPIVGYLGAWASTKYDHAHRLTQQLDELYPIRRAKPSTRMPRSPKAKTPSK